MLDRAAGSIVNVDTCACWSVVDDVVVGRG